MKKSTFRKLEKNSGGGNTPLDAIFNEMEALAESNQNRTKDSAAAAKSAQKQQRRVMNTHPGGNFLIKFLNFYIFYFSV